MDYAPIYQNGKGTPRIHDGVNCTMCGNAPRPGWESTVTVGTETKTYDLLFCETCGAGITAPAPSPEELGALYSDSYRSRDGKRFNSLMESVVYLFRIRRRNSIHRFVRQGSILDIGCGRGLFLSIMKRCGWSVTGVEVNEEAARRAGEAYGVDVFTEKAAKSLPNGSYDVITLYHVLEHMPRPAEAIFEYKRLLKKNGLLVIAVPNLSSLQAAVGKGKWFHLDVPYHLHHFTEEGLVSLARRHSFEVLRIRRFDPEQNIFGWLQTLFNLSGIEGNGFYAMLKKADVRKAGGRGLRAKDLLLIFFLLPVYAPASTLLALFESFVLRRGGRP